MRMIKLNGQKYYLHQIFKLHEYSVYAVREGDNLALKPIGVYIKNKDYDAYDNGFYFDSSNELVKDGIKLDKLIREFVHKFERVLDKKLKRDVEQTEDGVCLF